MRSECCLILLFVLHLSCFRRLGKLLGDVVISQGGVGEYRNGLFYPISDSFVQCPTLRLNFCQRRQARERRKVKRLSRSWISESSRLLYFAFDLYITVSLVTLFRIGSKSCLSISFSGCLTCNSKCTVLATPNYVRSSLTGTVRSLSNRCVEGTRCPPMLDTKFTRSDGSRSSMVPVDERLGEVILGEVPGERGGAPMTWTISCVSTLWISIVLLGRRDIT